MLSVDELRHLCCVVVLLLLMKIRTPKEIGSLVRQSRKDQSLTQLNLARRIGVSRDWIIRLEQGKGGVELALVLRTLKALGLVLDVQQSEPNRAEETGIDLDQILREGGHHEH